MSLFNYLPGAKIVRYEAKEKARALENILASVPEVVSKRLVRDFSKARDLLRDPVYVATGSAWNAKRAKAVLDERRGRVTLASRDVPRKAQKYLNNLSPKSFKFSAGDFLALRQIASALPPAKRDPALRILRRIQFGPVPQYSSGGPKTQRVSAPESLQSAHKWIRRRLGKAWLELDLSNCSLAIAQSILSDPHLDRYLRGDGSLWMQLYVAHQFVGPFPAFKEAVKHFAISTLMGSPPQRAAKRMRDRYEAAAGHPMNCIATSNLLRDPALAVLTSLRLVGGRVLKLMDGSTLNTDGLGDNTIVHLVMSAAEWSLLEPALDLAITESQKKKPGWRIVLWQHDGFSVQTTSKDPDRQQGIARKLQAAVADRAEELGILTHLALDYAPGQDDSVTTNVHSWKDLI